MAKMVCISLLGLLLASCASSPDAGVDVNALKDKGGDGLYESYRGVKRDSSSEAEQARIIGMKNDRVHGLSEPGIPVRQPAKTRTYWIAPRGGGEFATHGGFLTVIVEKEGFIGAPMRGKYVPNNDLEADMNGFEAMSNEVSSDVQDMADDLKGLIKQ